MDQRAYKIDVLPNHLQANTSSARLLCPQGRDATDYSSHKGRAHNEVQEREGGLGVYQELQYSIMTNKEKHAIKRNAKFLELKRKGMRMFIASKSGGNAKGRGASRSVVLASIDGKKWFQHAKFWGKYNVQEAKNYVDWFNGLK